MEALEVDLTLIQQIFDHQPEATVLVHPVWQNNPGSNDKTIIDFKFSYCNSAIQGLNGKSKEELIGKLVLADKLPDPGICETIFTQCVEVYKTGKPLEYSYFSTVLEKYVTLKRVKVQGGVLTTARNRTAEYKTQVEKDQQRKLLEGLVESSPYGISLYESIRDSQGQIIDFRLKLCNSKSAELTALTLEQLQTNTVKELMALRGQSHFFDICVRVVEKGEPNYSEYYSDAMKRWLAFSIVKFDDGYLLNYIDITKPKNLEQEAKHHAHELNTIFNGSLSGIYSAKVVRNDKGIVSDLIFLRANDAFYKMFSITEESLIGTSLITFSGAVDQSQFIKYAGEVIETGAPANHVLKYDNPERWFTISMVKLEEDVLSITVNDISYQMLATAEIERQKNLLDNILRQSPNGISVTKAIRNEKGDMVDAIAVLMNDACEKLNGVSNQVLLTNTMGTLDPGILSSPLFKSAKELSVGGTFRTEYFLPLSGRWLELAVAKMDEDHFINVFTDISATKDAQLQLQKTVEELKRLNNNLEDFAYAASHDMKEPIRKIHFFADRLKSELKDTLNEEQTHLFNRLEYATKRMGILIDDLLAYSHVTKGIIDVEEINLNQKIENVLIDLELEIQQKEAHITVSSLPVVKGNRRQLQQLFQNLISNALKYSKPNEKPQIQLSSSIVQGGDLKNIAPPEQSEKRFHLIEVRDNGIGFEQKDAERIFNVFTRLHGGKEYRGTGVGLSLVRKVVENHNGFVWAESKVGVGSTFRVLLPV